jgi:glycosyltransferase involved in cell wall biosynthesis
METIEKFERRSEPVRGDGAGELRWLFVMAEFPWPMNHGTWLRLYHLTRSLRAAGDAVSILCHGDDVAGREKYAEAGVKILHGPAGVAPHRGRARCLLGPYVYDGALAESLSAVAGDYDVVVLVRPCMLQYAAEAGKAGCVLADMVDDPMLEEGRRWWMETSPRRLSRRVRFLLGEVICERQYLSGIDLSIFVSGQDADSFCRRHRKAQATWVPNGVEVSHFGRPETEGGLIEPPVVSFVGNMVHPPNEEAAWYLLRRIAPLVWKQEPTARFQIIGSHPSRRLCGLAGANVEVTGWVEDVRPMLWKSTVVLLPMRTGTGIKNKLLEAWAARLAVVATPLASQGVPVREGENILLGSSPAELAAKTVAVIRDEKLRRGLGEAGEATVTRYLSWPTVASQFRQVAMDRLARKMKVAGMSNKDSDIMEDTR